MNNNIDQLNIKSLRSYGIHGALGLLMGIGIGYIVFYMITILNSVSSLDLIGVSFAFASLIIYGLFGLYIGYVFGGQKKSSVTSISINTEQKVKLIQGWQVVRLYVGRLMYD